MILRAQLRKMEGHHAGPAPRPGRINTGWWIFLGSGVTLLFLFVLLGWNPLSRFTEKEPPALLVYCGAGLKKPVSEAARQYEEEYGVKVEIQYGGSQTLLANLEVAKQGDIYIPGDASYLDLAAARELVDERIPLARMQGVLAYRKDAKKKPTSLDDILNGDYRLSHANPEAAAVGKLSRDALGPRWEQLRKKVVVFKPTVNETANDVVVGAVDAGVVFDAVAAQMGELEFVRLPEFASAHADISLGILRSSSQPTEALKFARYLAARDRGLTQFQENGFVPVQGDRWEENPAITIYAGAMLRPAIDETITEFAAREGVTVNRVYNGCGILLNLMQSTRPDVYYSCDVSFMNQVRENFENEITLSSNPMVIIVPPDSKHDIKEIKDLGQPGLRVGFCNPTHSALGALTWQLLEANLTPEELAAIKANAKVETPQGDYLVTHIGAGALDAAIVYRSNANASKDKIGVIPIDLPQAVATQPVGVSRSSEFKQLTARLFDALRSEKSMRRFKDAGLKWETDETSEGIPPNPADEAFGVATPRTEQ